MLKWLLESDHLSRPVKCPGCYFRTRYPQELEGHLRKYMSYAQARRAANTLVSAHKKGYKIK